MITSMPFAAASSANTDGEIKLAATLSANKLILVFIQPQKQTIIETIRIILLTHSNATFKTELIIFLALKDY